MLNFEIRLATSEDAKAIAQIWLEATAEVAEKEPLYTPAISEADLTERLSQELKDGVKKGFVAYASTDLAAYVTFREELECAIFAPRRYLYLIDT